MLRQWLNTFVHDGQVHIFLLLVMLDFAFGVGASIKLKTFRLSFIADTLKSDILGKMVPYFAIYAGALVAGSEEIVIPQLDLNAIAHSAWGLISAAMVGSILNSVHELGWMPTQLQKTALVADEGHTGDASTVIQKSDN